MATRFEEAFTNKFGQVIYPGDKVAVAVLSRKRTFTYTGTYVGYVGEDPRYKRTQVLTIDRWSKTKALRINTLWDNNIFPLENKNASV